MSQGVIDPVDRASQEQMGNVSGWLEDSRNHSHAATQTTPQTSTFQALATEALFHQHLICAKRLHALSGITDNFQLPLSCCVERDFDP